MSTDASPWPPPGGKTVPAGGFVPGAAGAGDPYFPKAGNGGYDVGHYDIRLRYEPRGRKISGTTRITATATQNLSRFDLDFVGNRVRKITVDGVNARYERAGQELIVTPAAGIPSGTRFTVAVAYDGSPPHGKNASLGRTGWIRTPDGAVTLSQPQGSATWFPLNDHPSDKATHTYTITVPKGLTVVANGEPSGELRRTHRALTNHRAHHNHTPHQNHMPHQNHRAHQNHEAPQATRTYRWRSRHPMASYLAMVAIGKFRVMDGASPKGVRTITAVDSSLKQNRSWLQKTTGTVTDWGTRTFGPYPFDSTGGVVDNVKVGYALETQTRPVYPHQADTALLVHELAHQWFGDSVGLKRWKDIWLNEGFATYAEWLYTEQHRGATAKQMFAKAYKHSAGSAVWKRRTGAPGRKGMFDYFAIYTRGAMTLHALRTAVGDPTFFRILRTWVAAHAHGHATTDDFIKHAERVSERPLRPVFKEWLYKSGKPGKPKRVPRPAPKQP
ncbi:M1 family metallopeptidase [Actinomadura sp. 9N407]|uniref:M1 family metallopeptidase n=1 Tax=Actinomadura sp. 9N407 TaxID=3375154 RepID=UPI0037AC8844